MHAGTWLRPEYYAVPGKTRQEAIAEEVTAVRQRVGLIDVGTLGKLEISGPERTTVLQGTKQIAKVNYYRERGKVKVKSDSGAEAYESNTTNYSAAFGVLMMTAIPEVERYIVMAEIMARGR